MEKNYFPVVSDNWMFDCIFTQGILYLWLNPLVLHDLCSRPHIHHASFNGAVLSKQAEARSSHPGVFLGKGALKIYSKFTGEHPYWSAISIKLESNFIEITFRHGCSPVNYLQIFITPFRKNPTRMPACEKLCKCWYIS